MSIRFEYLFKIRLNLLQIIGLLTGIYTCFLGIQSLIWYQERYVKQSICRELYF